MRQEAFFQKSARLCIVLATLIWGSAFVVMKNTIDTVPICYLLAFRFVTAAILLGGFLLLKGKRPTRGEIWRGMVMGFFLILAYATQTFGLLYVTPSVSAFLTTVYCIIVPLLYWLVAKKRPDRYNLLASILCITGVGLISFDGGSGMAFGAGAILTLASGFFFACHMVAVGKSTQGRDVFWLTAVQFATAGVLAAICGVCTERFPTDIWTGETIFCLVYLTLFCTIATLLLQALGQKYTEPAAASVLLSLESVFAVVFSILFYGDRPSFQLFCGFGLIFCAVLCSETKLSFLRKKDS